MHFNNHLPSSVSLFSKPPSQATNNVIPKHIRKVPVAIWTLYNKAR